MMWLALLQLAGFHLGAHATSTAQGELGVGRVSRKTLLHYHFFSAHTTSFEITF